MQLQTKFDNALEYMHYFIEVLACRTKTHYRVLDNNKPKIKFPVNHQLGDRNYIDWEMEGDNGWGKADVLISKDLELRYLWKNEKMLTFEQWLKNKADGKV